MTHVAIAACLAADSESVFPDPDFPLLEARLSALGIEVTPAAWEDTRWDWSAFDLVVIRSTWTSVDSPDGYLAWLDAVSRTTAIENAPSLVEWNLDKRHLIDLTAAGIPTVPTTWVAPGAHWDSPAGSFVVKPAVSGGGRDTALYTHAGPVAEGHVRRLQAGGATVMIQPHVESIDAAGETKMVYLDGDFSHAVNVGPLLSADAGVIERPWEKPVRIDAAGRTQAEAEIADQTMSYVEQRFGPPLYGRVDTCLIDGEPVVLEVEFVDPSLSLWAHRDAPSRLAAAIRRRLR